MRAFFNDFLFDSGKTVEDDRPGSAAHIIDRTAVSLNYKKLYLWAPASRMAAGMARREP